QIDRETNYLIFGFAPSIWPENTLPENFTYRRIKPWRWLGPLALEAARRHFVRQHVSNYRVDLLHCTLEMVPVYDEQTRVLFSLYDLARLSPHFMYSAEQNLRNLLRTRLRYSLAKKADLLHTISEFSADQIAARLKIDRARIRVIHPGYDPRFCPGEADRNTLQKYGLADRRYLLFVGEFGRQKNEEGLIRAYFAARAERGLGADTALVLVGDPAKLKAGTRALVASHQLKDDILLLGHVSDDDLVHLYRGATAMVLPSYYEGFGLPALEAMACGAVPVVSRATSLPEVVGDAGLLVSPGNTAELAEALSRVCSENDLRTSLAEKALARAQQFTFAGMARAQWELYREMIDG
ncbi:MAG: glycosyltransferase family 4 protein, partial [Alphaproteobacteria bacterium]